jgi:hypothetical protein
MDSPYAQHTVVEITNCEDSRTDSDCPESGCAAHAYLLVARKRLVGRVVWAPLTKTVVADEMS